MKKFVENKFDSAEFSAELVSSFVEWVQNRINQALLLSSMVECLGRGESVTLGPFISDYVVEIARRTAISKFTGYADDSKEGRLWETTADILDGDYFAGNYWDVFEALKDEFVEEHY